MGRGLIGAPKGRGADPGRQMSHGGTLFQYNKIKSLGVFC
jgi:hypothetical protein